MQILKIRYKKGTGGIRNGIEKSMDVLGHREKKATMDIGQWGEYWELCFL